jgi:hypothetical protein
MREGEGRTSSQLQLKVFYWGVDGIVRDGSVSPSARYGQITGQGAQNGFAWLFVGLTLSTCATVRNGGRRVESLKTGERGSRFKPILEPNPLELQVEGARVGRN